MRPGLTPRRRNGGRELSDPIKDIEESRNKIICGIFSGIFLGFGIGLISVQAIQTKVLGCVLFVVGFTLLIFSLCAKFGKPGRHNSRSDSAADGFRSVLLAISAAGLALVIQIDQIQSILGIIALVGFGISLLVLLFSWQLQKAKAFVRSSMTNWINEYKFKNFVFDTWWMRNEILDILAMSSMLMSIVITLGLAIN